MEKKEFDHDLIAPKGYLTEYSLYFQVLTERLNVLWAEHLKNREKKNGKGDKKLNSRSDQ